MYDPSSFVVHVDSIKGRQIISKRISQAGDLIFEDQPLVLAQFEWNKAYKYASCDFCLFPLETCEENVRRLTQDKTIVLPHPELDENRNVQQRIVRCEKCQEIFCSSLCYQKAMMNYHATLCLSNENPARDEFIRQILELWKSAHPPPETTSIRLILKLMAMLKQTENRRNLLEELQKFSQGVSSENQRFYHKLLRKEFQSQVEQVRYALEQFNEQFMQIDEFRWFLSGQGFRHLLALLGRNQQGIGTSPLARWVKNCETLSNQSKCVAAAAAAGPDELSQWIDAIYLKIDEVSGEFLDAEGSGLFRLQSCLNHSCDANAEIQYRYNNSTLSVVATRTIQPDEEVTINYLSECDRNRSRYSRQKLLQSNYLFLCQCNRCLAEASEPNETSEEEDDDDDQMDDD